MPQLAAAAIAEYVGGLAVAEVIVDVAIVAASMYISQDMARRQQNAAKDAYNASLQDRYVMTRASADPRQLVLGRQRVSGPMFYVGSYGPNQQYLVFTVALAGHEIDGVEAIYFDDEQVTLDTDGNVIGVNRRDQFSLTTATDTYLLSSIPYASTLVAKVSYGTTTAPLTVALTNDASGKQVTVTGGDPSQLGEVTITYQPNPSPYAPTTYTSEGGSVTLDASGNGVYAFSTAPIAGSISVVGDANGGLGNSVDNVVKAQLSFTVSDETVSIVGGTDFAGAVVTVSAQTFGATTSFARVRWHLGEPGQAADAGMLAELPGVWTAEHVANSVAYLVCEFNFDPNAFPNGIPNVSAQVRGAKVYDPRSGATAWSDNAALLLRAAATHILCGRLDPGLMNDASFIAAANICGAPTPYVVGTNTYGVSLYAAGTCAKSGTKPADVLNELAQAMAGKWVFVDGLLRVKAGSYIPPLQTLDDTWLADGQKIHIQPRSNRADVYNVVTGKFADQSNDYMVLDYPRIQADSYIAEDGSQLPLDIPLNAVTFVAQAQQVVAATLRDARQALKLTVLCNMRAYQVEVFDTLYVTLDRFGFADKPFEVYDVTWTPDGGIQLSMKEVDTTAWDLGTEFAAADPAPNTLLPSPFLVPNIIGLLCQSGTAQLLKQSDGTIVSRILVTWDALTDASVITNGGVEVRYGIVNTPEATWQSEIAQGGQTAMYLTGVQDGQAYLIKARAFSSLVQGSWCVQQMNIVVGKTAPPVDVAGLTATVVPSGVRFNWTADSEADYADTELRVGNTWTESTELFFGSASSYSWLSPSVGTYTILAKHFDTTGNESVNPASVSVTVTASDAVSWSSLADRPMDLFNMVATPQFETGDARDWGGYGATVGNANNGPQPFLKALQVVARDTLEDASETPVRANETLYVYADMDSSHATVALGFSASFKNNAGQRIFTDPPTAELVPGNTWQRVGGSMQVPPAAVSMVPWIQLSGPAGTDMGYGQLTNLYIGRAAPGATLGATWGVDVIGAAAVNELITAAAGAATIAGNQAASAIIELTNIASDNVLSAGEKPRANVDYSAIVNEEPGIVAQAQALGITAELNSYVAIFTDLQGYLAALSPAFGDFTKDTPIDGPAFRGQFVNLYNARQTLLNKIAAVIQSNAAEGVSSAAIAAASAKNALDAAKAAQADATNAIISLENIASDNILSKGEKPGVIVDWYELYNAQGGIDTQANAVGVSPAAFDQAISQLGQYLTDISPSWADTTTDSPIVGVTFQNLFIAAYNTRQALLNAIAAQIQLNATTASQLAQKAANDAAAAQLDARNAIGELANIASDNILSSGEKPGVIVDWYDLYNAQGGIDAQADAVGVSRVAYDAAISQLGNYLSSISPSWSDTTVDSPISAAIFQPLFVSAYNERQAVLNSISAAINATAQSAGQVAASAANAALLAQQDAKNAISNLNYIASSNVLSRSEKASVIIDWYEIYDGQGAIDQQADAMGVSRVNYDLSVSQLGAYLGGITPSWDDATVDSPIVGSTFQTLFINAYTSRQSLLNAIAADAAQTAAWDSVSGIPYSSVYNNDDSVALGFSMEDWPATGAAYPNGWINWSGPGPSRETTIVRAGLTSVNYAVNGGVVGMVHTSSFANNPLPAGTFLAGTIDIWLGSVSYGLPGVLCRVYTNAAQTTYQEIFVQPSSTVSVWQRIPWSLRAGTPASGAQIYGIQAYLMASPDGRAPQFSGQVVFDNFMFAFYDASIDNSALNLNTDGTLVGGGGGQVTIVGLGFTGSLQATRNVVTTSPTAPANAVDGDLWFNTTLSTWEAHLAGSWQVVSDITAANIAAGIQGQGALATLNAVNTAQIAANAATEITTFKDTTGMTYSNLS